MPTAATGVRPVRQQPGRPEALEELLAPVALYPDPVLSQVLIASTNPQEVLDAGNWLIANEGLKGKELDAAAAQIGFTPPVRALVQFPQTIDMMCMEMGWTTELGQAFVADQAGVLDAVQRLRRQAMDVGNLQTSDAMMVETTEQDGKEVVVLKPPQPDVVYVPTYDPQTAYAPAPAAPAATTTTTTTTTKTGHSTGSMIATGVLAFGAGILVSELLDDDDDDYYYPNYGYGGMPYYPPYPYRPSYGGGYYPSNGYNRPPNYNSGFQNNGTIVINNPGGNGGGGYWDRYDNQRTPGDQHTSTAGATARSRRRSPNRSDLNTLNQRQPRPMPADVEATVGDGDRLRTGKASRRTRARPRHPPARHGMLRTRVRRHGYDRPRKHGDDGPRRLHGAEGAGLVCGGRSCEACADVEGGSTEQSQCAAPGACLQAVDATASRCWWRRSRLRHQQCAAATLPASHTTIGRRAGRHAQHGDVGCKPRQRGPRGQRTREAEHAAGRAQQGRQRRQRRHAESALRRGTEHEQQPHEFMRVTSWRVSCSRVPCWSAVALARKTTAQRLQHPRPPCRPW